jgi:predicted NUDIX family NTP pyrophosphohydrolase
MKLSAGILLYRRADPEIEVLLGHPGGPWWARKDAASWSIPKGEQHPEEQPWTAAQREFSEELGCPPPDGPCIEFEPVKQPGGKLVTVFAIEADLDVSEFRSNTFRMMWPPRSGMFQEFPELDRVAWLPISQAQVKILKGQRIFLEKLLTHAQ